MCAALVGDWLPGARCFPIKPVTGGYGGGGGGALHEKQGESGGENAGGGPLCPCVMGMF